MEIRGATGLLRSLVARALVCIAASTSLCAVTFAARAQSVVTVQSHRLAAWADGDPPVAALIVDDQPVVLGATSARVLREGAANWTLLAWRPHGVVIAAVGEGAVGDVLVGPVADGAADHIERLALQPGPIASVTPLPTALASPCGAVLDGSLYLAGMDASGAFALRSIALATLSGAWTVHPSPPSRAGVPHSLVAQGSALWLAVADGAHDRLLRFSPRDGWSDRGAIPGTVVRGATRATGQAHEVYLFDEGARTSLATYQTVTGSWARLDTVAVSGARIATGWRHGLIAIARDGRVVSAQIDPAHQLLRWLDWLVIGVYLVAMLGIGLYFYRREKRTSTSDFFVGGRSIPFWAAGISLYAANTSSISYIAIPAKSFETNWQYLTNNLITVVGLVFVAIWIVPLLRRLDLLSVFQYLETRFHPVIRTLASALFIAVQIGSRLSVILFLPSLAIATMTGIDVVWSILIMGAFTMVYTALGGMKAVVWTDVVQLAVKMGGIFFTIAFIARRLPGGLGNVFHVAAADHKMRLFDFRFDLSHATVWGFVFLVLFDVVLTFPKDQVLMQRVLSTRSDRDAGRSVWTFAAVMIPGGLLFYFVGTALYVFYKSHPERMNPLLAIDATFPYFIAAELPMGVRGLIIAGILAAAMATLSSIMNSVATLASVDFYEKLVARPDPRVSVRLAEWMTVVTGVLGIAVACLLSRFDIHSLFDTSIELAGLLGGGFAGAYTLGMFTRRANWQGVAIGVAVSITVTTTAGLLAWIHPYFYLALSILVCIVVGYLASWFFPPPRPEALAGLTLFGPRVGGRTP